MLFKELKIKGAWLIELEKKEDERGFFARTWCQEEFKKRGLVDIFVQCSISYNKSMGTLRGLHYQSAPYEEVKVVRCTKGAICDVILDLRSTSDSYGEWHAEELTEQNYLMLYIPKGVAHGFQTLEAETEILYQMSEPYRPGSGRGIRWDDRTLRINWPIPNPIVSVQDRNLPAFSR